MDDFDKFLKDMVRVEVERMPFGSYYPEAEDIMLSAGHEDADGNPAVRLSVHNGFVATSHMITFVDGEFRIEKTVTNLLDVAF